MNINPETSENLDGQIQALKGMIESTHRLLGPDCQSSATQINENLNQLYTGITRLGQQIARRKVEQANLLALTEVSQVVNSSLDLDDVLRIVMDTIVRLTGAERGFLMLRDESGKLDIRIARNWEQNTIDPSEFAISRTVIQRVIVEGNPVLTTNAQEDPRFDQQQSIIAYNLRSILCVPLKVKGELTGVIYADNRIRTGLFSESERNLLATFANQAAIAIENARLFASVRRTLAEVTELKDLMDNVFASIVSGVITTDIQDRVILCNRAAQEILGQVSTYLVGRSLPEALPPLAEQMSRSLLHVRRDNRPIVGIEVNTSLPRRGPVNLRMNFSPLKDASQATQGVAIVVDDLTEKRRLEAMRRMFERMVSPKVIEQLDPDQLKLGGQRALVTALFADIRGFTRFSENQDPESLVSVLNCYLAAAAETVLAQDGMVDKFQGDAVMALFNAPIPQEDHPIRAVRTAIGIRDAVHALHCKLPPMAHLSFGIGIHYGEAVLGLVGTEQRLEYTAIGDSINTAKRIQENALPGQVLISASVYELVKDQVEAHLVAPIHAKGKSQPIEVYEIGALKE